jgi:hypothetical protein
MEEDQICMKVPAFNKPFHLFSRPRSEDINEKMEETELNNLPT